MTLIAILHQILPRERRKSSASFGAVDLFLTWTFFAGIISNLFFFGRPGIALFGGFAFALFFLPYTFSRWLGRP
jgi:putative membrane protein